MHISAVSDLTALTDHPAALRAGWADPPADPACLAAAVVGGDGDGLEVAVVDVPEPPTAATAAGLWRARRRGSAEPLLLLCRHPSGVRLVGATEPQATGLLPEAAAVRLAASTLPYRSPAAAAVAFAEALAGLSDGTPVGVVNDGLVAAHQVGVAAAAAQAGDGWAALTAAGQAAVGAADRRLLTALGFGLSDRTAAGGRLLTVDGQPVAAVAVGVRRPTVATVVADARRRRLRWAVDVDGSRLRIYAAEPGAAVSRRPPTAAHLMVDGTLLEDGQEGLLPLLAGPQALADGGTLSDILARSETQAYRLGGRLRERVFDEVVPALATVSVRQAGSAGTPTPKVLDDCYSQTLTLLFRILFCIVAEHRRLLPADEPRYRPHGLTELAVDLCERDPSRPFSGSTHRLWERLSALFAAVSRGRPDWAVPQYNGGLFSDDPQVSPAGAALAGWWPSDADLGPALVALLTEEQDGQRVPVDFAELSVREFGTIYEGLLDIRLAVAVEPLTLDRKGLWVPAGDRPALVDAGEPYLRGENGARKASESYFTPQVIVDNLLDRTLEPALADHLRQVEQVCDRDGQQAAVDLLLQFAVIDPAVGSGHFLLTAVDRIEAAFQTLLARLPLPPLEDELDRLAAAAAEAAGGQRPASADRGQLLRRLIARRCVYGVDRNPLATELARLALWMHTFVAGLPLSYLDRNLRTGDSLTGIATLDEAAGLRRTLHHGDPSQATLTFDGAGGSSVADLDRMLAGAVGRLADGGDRSAADVAAARAADRAIRDTLADAAAELDALVYARTHRLTADTGLPGWWRQTSWAGQAQTHAAATRPASWC